MGNEHLYNELPVDPEEAFLLLEREFRNECQQRVRDIVDGENIRVHYVDYIAQVLAAITELGLEAEFRERVPQIENVDYDTYLNFSKDVKHYRTMLEIRHGRRVQGFSVRFDAITKQKLRHFLQQIRDVLTRLEVDQNKRDALFGKVEALEKEIDRDRTRLEAYGALVIESAGVLGDAAEKLEPVRKWLDSIGRVIWGAKKEEEQMQLPGPSPRKRIEPPRPTERPASENRSDDEIPF